jgi:hypothetical protein
MTSSISIEKIKIVYSHDEAEVPSLHSILDSSRASLEGPKEPSVARRLLQFYDAREPGLGDHCILGNILQLVVSKCQPHYHNHCLQCIASQDQAPQEDNSSLHP